VQKLANFNFQMPTTLLDSIQDVTLHSCAVEFEQFSIATAKPAARPR
jgi:hypothetical protein